MAVPPIFTAGILVDPIKEFLGFLGLYRDESMSFISQYRLLSTHEIYLCFHYSREICRLIQHYAYHILHNIWPM